MAASTETAPQVNLPEVLLSAIKATQELRVSVSNVFDQLNNGLKSVEGGEAKGVKEKQYLNNFHQRLLSVVKNQTELEKLSASIPPNVTTPPLGNTTYLTVDSIVDKTPTYHHLIQAYKWSSKAQEHSAIAAAILNQHSLKRSQTSSLLYSKRPRKAQSTSHSVQPNVVDSLIERMERKFAHMNIKASRPIGSPAVLNITIGQTLRALVVLRGLVIEWVMVKGYDEDFLQENGKLDLYSQSRYQVFRKVTEHTHAAMLHYYSPVLLPEYAVQSFLQWLQSYNSLFSAPCHRCGKFLKDNLPPTWRDTKKLDVYHVSCRP